MNIAFVVDVTEHERGWGSRPDGSFVFKTEADADAFLKAKYAGRTLNNVPDEYDSYDKVGYKEVTELTMTQLAAAAAADGKLNGVWYKRNSDFMTPK